MKRYTGFLLGLFLTLFAPLAFAGSGWQTDLEKAMELAKKENKAVLVEFTGSDWCPPCQFMHKKVFSKKEFIQGASEDYVLVELDFPNGNPALAKKNQPYAEKYGIEGFPSVVLLDAKGKVLDKFIATGYPSVDAFLEHIRSKKA